MKIFTLFTLILLSNISSMAENLRPTSYSIQPIKLKSSCDDVQSILDTHGRELVKVCKNIYRKCVLEGTCALLSSRADDEVIRNIHKQMNENNKAARDSLNRINIINYVQLDKNRVPRFEVVNKNRCPFGLGARSICLDPFYSVAADLKYHRLGDVIYVPSLKGVVLPNGEKHNGFMVVRDRGGAIKEADRFDFFLGFIDFKDSLNPFARLGLADKRNKIQFRKATEAETQEVRKQRNFPKIPMSI